MVVWMVMVWWLIEWLPIGEHSVVSQILIYIDI